MEFRLIYYGTTFPAGNHRLSFNLRVMRIMDSNANAQSILNQAIVNQGLDSYCTNNNVSSVILDHGRFAAGEGDENEASATVEYECNLDTARPKITFKEGANPIPGNQVKICDGLFSVLAQQQRKRMDIISKQYLKVL
ncbi:hypothetical protein ACS106_004401 [Escherichia coli]